MDFLISYNILDTVCERKALYETYTEEEVIKLKECAGKIIKWIEEQLK